MHLHKNHDLVAYIEGESIGNIVYNTPNWSQSNYFCALGPIQRVGSEIISYKEI